MATRFYVDADILGLGKILAATRSDVTYPGDPGGSSRDGTVRPPCPVTDPNTKDPVWVPVVAGNGWLIITRDKKMRRRPAEIEAIKANSARVVALSGSGAKSLWGQLELVVANWSRIETLAVETGPFFYRLASKRLTRVELD